MDRDDPLSDVRMVELAARRGLVLDAGRAAAIRPAVDSLLGRLESLARSLTPEDFAAPGPREGKP